jgi:squalene-hopene/tetraprenyl-beta-curcumene cyclase
MPRAPLLAALILFGGCSRPASHSSPARLGETRDARIVARDRGVAYLLSRQSADGAWRSDIYGQFKNGDALTPQVVVALQRCPETPEIVAAVERGIAWLRRFVIDGNGEQLIVDPDAHLQYPVYTASLAVMALSDPRQQQHANVRDAWMRFLIEHQFREENGWHENDWQLGGWGYAGIVPVKPRQGPIPDALEANISATAYALTALRQGRMTQRDPVLGRALKFVKRCQNWKPIGRDPVLDDGGFFFTPDDPFRNKAGLASKPGAPTRYRSYGSASADGMRCLQALHELVGDEISAAEKWLRAHLEANGSFKHHGDFASNREKDRDSAFFYYSAVLGDTQVFNSYADTVWKAVAARQRQDGSWRNELNTVREDDPIVATALAISALR